MPVARRVMLIAALAGVVAVGGCANTPKDIRPPSATVSPYDTSKGEVLWAVLPLRNESGTLQAQRLAPALAGPVISVLVDSNGQVWAGTETGLSRIAPDGTVAPTWPAETAARSAVYDIEQARDGRLWLAVYGGGVATLDDYVDVKLAVDDFFDDPRFIRLSECDDAAGTACTETLITFNPGGPGLITTSANSQIGGGFPCQLYYSKATAALTGAALTFGSITTTAAAVLAAFFCGDAPTGATTTVSLSNGYTVVDTDTLPDHPNGYVPIAIGYGVHPVHFAMIMCVNLTIGLATPPMGLVLFVTSSVAGERVGTKASAKYVRASASKRLPWSS